MRTPVFLFFHQLLQEPRPGHHFFRYSPTFDQFRSFVVRLKRHYRPLTMEAFAHGWDHGRRWPAGSVVLTFDDGFRNNLQAAEILHEHGIQATFFVLSDVVDSNFVPWYLRFTHTLSTRSRHVADLDGIAADLSDHVAERRWKFAAKEHLLAAAPARRDQLLQQLSEQLQATPIDPHDPDYAYLTGEDLRRIRALGMVVGCHAATHTDLLRCDDGELHYELVESRRKLAGHLGEPVHYVSYPDGRFNESVLRVAGEHYRFGFAATPTYAADHPMRLPRRGSGPDMRSLSSWYPLKRRCVSLAKRCLGMGR